MALTEYNGWSGKIRDKRGSWFYKENPKEALGKCTVCGSYAGLTFHAEEYGSTIASYLDACHELCAYCHGMIHMRFRYPNRWARYKHRAAEGYKFIDFAHLGAYFAAMKVVADIKPGEYGPSGIDWLDALPTESYKGPPKIATVLYNHKQIPDPQVYAQGENVQGVTWDSKTGAFTPYAYYVGDLFE